MLTICTMKRKGLSMNRSSSKLNIIERPAQIRPSSLYLAFVYDCDVKQNMKIGNKKITISPTDSD